VSEASSTAFSTSPGAALARLRDQLRLLHRRSGEPRFDIVAQRTSAIGPATVRDVLRCESPPGWGALELVVRALGGDPEEFRLLWNAVRDGASPPALPHPAAWEDEKERQPRSLDLSIPELDAQEEDLQDRAARRRRREGETRQELLRTLEARADLADRLNALHEQLGRERGRNDELRRQVATVEAERAAYSQRIEVLQDELRAVREERLVLLQELNSLHARRADLYFTWAREEERQRRVAEAGQEERDREVRELESRLGAAESLLRSVLAAQPPTAAVDDEPPAPRSDRTRWYRARRES